MGELARIGSGIPHGGRFAVGQRAEATVGAVSLAGWRGDLTQDPDLCDAHSAGAVSSRAEDSGVAVEEMSAQMVVARRASYRLLGPDPMFVHFTDGDSATRIAHDGQLWGSSTICNVVFAAAAGGANVPGVQQGTTSERGFGRVEGARDYAVVFRTRFVPEECDPAEVAWLRSGPLPIADAIVVARSEAVGLLDESVLTEDDAHARQLEHE